MIWVSFLLPADFLKSTFKLHLSWIPPCSFEVFRIQSRLEICHTLTGFRVIIRKMYGGDKNLSMGWTNCIFKPERLSVTWNFKHNMLYLSKTSLLYALTPIFQVFRPSTDFTDDRHQYTYPHLLVYSDIYIGLNSASKFRISIFMEAFRVFLGEWIFCVDKFGGHRFFVGHIKVYWSKHSEVEQSFKICMLWVCLIDMLLF